MASQIEEWTKPVTNEVYMWIYQYKLLELNIDAFWQIVILFLAFEFIYYWTHRIRHSVRLFWLEHNVHHAVMHVNFMTGLQKSWMLFFTGAWLMRSTYYFIGFDPLYISQVLLFGSLYQFILHTELVPRLGWLEYIFNTPSNHRVHHAQNSIYFHKNFGGCLVVFDILFGTYQKELATERCVYGIKNMEDTVNPVKIVFREWIFLFRDLKKSSQRFFTGNRF